MGGEVSAVTARVLQVRMTAVSKGVVHRSTLTLPQRSTNMRKHYGFTELCVIVKLISAQTETTA